MNTSKLYVPNATLWINFFKKKKRETVRQSGGGPKIVPINEISTDSTEMKTTNPVKLDLVSPVEAATNRVEQDVKKHKITRKTRTRKTRIKRTGKTRIKRNHKLRKIQKRQKLRKGKKTKRKTKKQAKGKNTKKKLNKKTPRQRNIFD